MLQCVCEQCGVLPPGVYELLVDLDNIASYSDYLSTEKSPSKGQGEQLHLVSFYPYHQHHYGVLNQFQFGLLLSHWHSKETCFDNHSPPKLSNRGKDKTNTISIEWGNHKRILTHCPRGICQSFVWPMPYANINTLLFKLISTQIFNIHSTNT